jgi:NAD(P)H dehydrogenase (quinone)
MTAHAPKTVVVLAHPDRPASRLNAAMVAALSAEHSIQVHDIYQAWTGSPAEVALQQQLMQSSDRIIFQFPLTWYSCPPRLSQWLAAVWTRGWSYGPGGRALNFKTFGVAVTTGSNGRDYTAEGRYRRTLQEVLVPFELLARHCGMHYLSPFSITAAREISDHALGEQASAYRSHVLAAEPTIRFDGSDDDRATTVYTRSPPATETTT